ncbi:MAG TPA: SIMPL domain-containing protein [Bacteriovoracaceae bacterium]|nr:SIMPL domain-containing protein [Bacteriovoracaceae bacterium]
MRLLACFFATCSLASINAYAAKAPHIQVQGTCEITVVPDKGSVTFTAENQSKDQQEAVKKTTDQINALKEKITALKLEHLEFKNTNYSVFPVREYEKNKYVDKGMRAALSLEVTSSQVARLGEAMQQASHVGITNIGELSTFLSIEKSQAQYLSCLDTAALDAKAKAIQLGKKLGFKVGEVIELVELPASAQRPVPIIGAAMLKGGMADSAATNVEAGTQKFNSSIQVSFSIK